MKAFILLFALTSFESTAAFLGPITSEATVVGEAAGKLNLMSSGGKRFTVPRSYVKAKGPIRSGQKVIVSYPHDVVAKSIKKN